MNAKHLFRRGQGDETRLLEVRRGQGLVTSTATARIFAIVLFFWTTFSVATAAKSLPYPPSPVIARIDWAPTNTIIRAARDGDNFPLTWADDDALYTTWGDGTGFIPKVEKKLSLGFALITGFPPDFTGTNIRS